MVSAADTLVLGRVTYHSFAGAWPHVPDNPAASDGEKDYARKVNSMRKIVFSRTLDAVEWNNSTLLHDISPDDIAALKQETGKNAVHKRQPSSHHSSFVTRLEILRHAVRHDHDAALTHA